MIRGFAVLALAFAMPVVAQTGAEQAAKPKPEKKVCRKMATTGSIMGGVMTCHTKTEWAAIDQRNGDNAAATRDLRGAGGNRAGGGSGI